MGCCSLRVEHIKLHPELDGQEYVVEFDFLGKDSIRYYNKVPVEKRVRHLHKHIHRLNCTEMWSAHFGWHEHVALSVLRHQAKK